MDTIGEMDVIIRRFDISDYEGARALWEKTPGMGVRNIDDSRDGIIKFLARNPGTCFAAVAGDMFAGSVLGGYDGRRGCIYHLCVNSGYGRRGIGAALLEKAVEALRAEGATKLYISCFKENARGNAFWRKMGWKVSSDVNYYGLVLDERNV